MLAPRPILRNHLREPARWEFEALPDFIRGASGVCSFRATLDPAIGRETVIAILDHTPFVFDLAKLRPFTLNLKAGVASTSRGAVFWLFFWLRNPRGPDPFAMWDVTLNAHDLRSLEPWWALAHQTHWHAFILGLGDEVLDMFEFENGYGLAESIAMAIDATANMPCTDFAGAKAEYAAHNGLAQLFALE